jgi:methionine-rich copper-binding protein CopC
MPSPHLTLWLIGLCVGVPATANAHAFLDHANPPVGAVVARAPAEVRLWFTERIEPRFSRLEVTAAGGGRIAAGGVVDRQQADQMSLRLPALKPGRYQVKWRVISVDTHETEGDFGFEVRP